MSTLPLTDSYTCSRIIVCFFVLYILLTFQLTTFSSWTLFPICPSSRSRLLLNLYAFCFAAFLNCDTSLQDKDWCSSSSLRFFKGTLHLPHLTGLKTSATGSSRFWTAWMSASIPAYVYHSLKASHFHRSLSKCRRQIVGWLHARDTRITYCPLYLREAVYLRTLNWNLTSRFDWEVFAEMRSALRPDYYWF